MSESPRPKRLKMDTADNTPSLRSLASFSRKISPPRVGDDQLADPATFDDKNDPLSEFFRSAAAAHAPREVVDLTVDKPDAKDITGTGFQRGLPQSSTAAATNCETQTWRSPFRLTRIRDLPESDNKDTVRLSEILGDVMLREVWLFNYMHNIPFVMRRFDPDIREHVKVVFVHGNWKKDDPAKQLMEVGGVLRCENVWPTN